MKALIKYWLRKFCGGNLHQVLGHFRAYRFPGDSELNPRLRVPVVMSGKRYWIRGFLNDLKPFIHEENSFDVVTWKDRFLWPILPVLTFGLVFNITDPHPLATCYRRLCTRLLMLKANTKLKWTKFQTWCAPFFTYDFWFGPHPLAEEKTDIQLFTERASDRLWERIVANWPGRLVITTGTGTFPHGMGETIRSVPNPDWKDAEYEFYVWTMDPLNVGPEPKKPKAPCKRSTRKSTCSLKTKPASKAKALTRRPAVKGKRRSA